MAQGAQHVIACATVIEEMLPLMPKNATYEVLDFGLHIQPEKLRSTLQERVDALAGQAETVILGYGLCSMAVVGVRARGCTLVVPRVDDCIAIFLGSRNAYKQQASAEPGTYYLTKGWIEVGDSPFAEYERMRERHGPARAERMVKLMLANYTRLALINTGQHELERFREYSQRTAERFDLRYEEIDGSTDLVRKMLFGPWDAGEFVIVPAEQTIEMEDFFPTLFNKRESGEPAFEPPALQP